MATVDRTGTERRMSLVYWLCAGTVFLSAFLLFLVQPIIGKHLLPWFGGSSFVWSTSLTFFTSLLFFGYYYVYWLSKRETKRQIVIHASIVAIGLCITASRVLSSGTLYPSLDWTLGSSISPALKVLWALLQSIGVPYFLLATTGPLVQHWYSLSSNKEPYRLYAISNTASLLALALYPSFLEPNFTLASQSAVWAVLFLVYVCLCSVLAKVFSTTGLAEPVRALGSRDKILARSSLIWIALAALPSALLVATTVHLTTAVASIPFLWIIPLGAYLLSFIVTFEGRGGGVINAAAVIAATYVAYAYMNTGTLTISVQLTADLVLLFAASLYCHARLYSRRPSLHDSSFFYVCVSLGGMLGAFLVSFVAPLVFTQVWEYPILISLSALVVLFTFPFLKYFRDEYALSTKRLRICLVILILVVSHQYWVHNQGSEYLNTRNYFGVVRISDYQGVRSEYNGSTLHGTQILDPKHQMDATTYYGALSGAGRAFTHFDELHPGEPKRVAVIGLGTGSLAAYCKPGDTFVFYEIDPRIEMLARKYYTYLKKCPHSEVRIGDARIVLEQEARQHRFGNYDLLFVDAFSDDSIPTHLLTKESYELFEKHMKSQESMIVIHTSNRYLALAPVVERVAKSAGSTALTINDDGNAASFLTGSEWVVTTKEPNPDAFETFSAGTSTPRHAKIERVPLWSDDYVNVMAVLQLPALFSWPKLW